MLSRACKHREIDKKESPMSPDLYGRTIRDMRNVLRYFDVTAANFDSIYSSPSFLDRIFRRDMYERFRRTLEECTPLNGHSVLDVGCGSGQYAIALAQRGAQEVVGLDFAQHMLELAAVNAQRAGVSDRCRFIGADFLTHRFDRQFGYVIAVGVFDYIEDPLPFLKKARELTRAKFITTFPRLFTWRAPVRKIRLMLKQCPVFFYTRARVVDLLTRAGFSVERFEVCGKIYWVSGTPN
jgi:cyclopropane fatty-acyl-phospholipid synthase-like methyltransferase